jgi:hypothetical protein
MTELSISYTEKCSASTLCRVVCFNDFGWLLSYEAQIDVIVLFHSITDIRRMAARPADDGRNHKYTIARRLDGLTNKVGLE